MKEMLGPIDKIGRADAREVEVEVEVQGRMVDIESLSLQEMIDEEDEIEVGTIDEMTTRTVVGGGSSFE